LTQAGSAWPATKSRCSVNESCWPLRSSGVAGWSRSTQSVHLLIFGASEFHSAEIAPNGHASMQ
jgi:hypothetical protein